ncbi:MAG: hypothetical protein COB67_08070 [SAR324 cluster bacterium]|uniref:DAGKc domain-containing protein n=1 Tax=SAR324 cluster bacterium TaxID=2024889 RepID=A0A2A4T1Y1_9DELT|nr:MAG: hypothetical protein COB67_08070 [SAR324 cluster bacterium]
MNILIVVNSNLSTKTQSFWNKYQELIRSSYPEASIYYPDSYVPQKPEQLENYQIIILVGNTPFFSRAINSFFSSLIDQRNGQKIAFLPDTKESAISSNLQLPTKVSQQIEVINSQQVTPVDLIRCHFINKDGIPASYLILNDVLIGVPVLKLPLFLKAFVQWLRTSSRISPAKIPHNITLKHNNQVIYEGSYIFAMLLLGNKITHGPKVYSKARIFRKSFEYIQPNPQPLREYTFSLPNLFSGIGDDTNENVFHRQFSELEVQGIGQENEIIADGNHIGRLPATFTLLPNSIHVISPRIFSPTKVTWASKFARAQARTPISNSRTFN